MSIKLASFLSSLAVLAAPSLLGQQTLTVTATRSVAVQPDQLVLSINVVTPLNTDLDDVLGVLAGSGVAASNLAGLISDQPSSIDWTFSLSVPIAKLKDTISTLTAIAASAAQKTPKVTVSFNAQSAQISSQLQATTQCPTADVMADARAQAQTIASRSGLTLGPILGLSDGSNGAVTVQARVGVVTATLGLVSGLPAFEWFDVSSFVSAVPTPCTVVVQFSVQPQA